MGKKPKEVSETKEQPELPAVPQQTFTDAEIQRVADFVNFVHRNATWNLTFLEFRDLERHFVNMKKHIDVMESHILDDIRVHKAK